MIIYEEERSPPPPARYHRPVEYRTAPYPSQDVWRHHSRPSPNRHGSPPRPVRHVSPPYRHTSPPRQAARQHRYSPSPHREEFMTTKYRISLDNTIPARPISTSTSPTVPARPMVSTSTSTSPTVPARPMVSTPDWNKKIRIVAKKVQQDKPGFHTAPRVQAKAGRKQPGLPIPQFDSETLHDISNFE